MKRLGRAERGASGVKIVIGILLGLVLLGAAGAGGLYYLASSVKGKVSCAKQVRAMLDFAMLRQSFELYRVKFGHYPSTDEGLQALVTAKIVDKVPLDPWGASYSYRLDGSRGLDEPFTVTSLGADRSPGGTGEAADLDSHMLQPPCRQVEQ